MNEDLKQLAIDVLKQYNIKPWSVRIIQGDSIKSVWKIVANGNVYCLKRLRQTLDKALFSVNAQIYLSSKGGNVPKVITNLNDQPITVFNDQIFVLYEWLEGKDLNFANDIDFEHAVSGLAKFHIASCGYQPPQEARTSTKQGRWPEQYLSMINKFNEWKEISSQNKSNAGFKSYLSCVDSIINIANDALDALKSSAYEKLAGDNNNLVLCHQDYGKGNAILTKDGVYVLDLDGVTFDLPTRDLRKIIGKIAQNNGTWDNTNIDKVVKWYSKVNQLSPEQLKILYIDLLFPHWFFGLVKNMFKNNKMIKPADIEKTTKLEQSKVALLNKLIKG